MKWPSANSSDRKSVFYTSEDSPNIISSSKQQQTQPQTQRQSSHKEKEGITIENNVFGFKMGADDETMTTKMLLENPKFKSSNSVENGNNGKLKSLASSDEVNGSADQDWKRYLKNFMLFSNIEKESEKFRREQQLAKIMKALMYFENKLRKEQEVIQQQLSEKDRVINRQMHTISNMKEKLGVRDVADEADDDINLPGTSGYCPMCRKKYYNRASKTISTQTFNNDNKFSTTNISDDYSSIPSIEYMSSSEEQEALLNPNPFSKARRSKKYTSKKSYKNYLQRPRNNSTAEDRNSLTNDVDYPASMISQQQPSDSNNNNITRHQSINGKEIGVSSKSLKIAGGVGGTGKFSLIMNDIHGIKQKHEPQHQNEIYDDTHSSKINRMHGISLNTIMKEKGRKAPDDDESEFTKIDDNHDNNYDQNDRGKSVENGNQSAINNKIEDMRDQQQQSILVSTTTKYCDEDLVVKQKIATRDDWYISDVDETETSMSASKTSYGNVTGVSNSVLECVNQILLQQSMDEFMDSHHRHHSSQQQTTQEKRSSFASNDSKDSQSNIVTPPTRSNKRVHFSTKNSMVQITPLPRQMLSDLHDNSTYENQSNYSNEYEPIGSARTYVDMDSKSLDNYKPKLPPKPDNLMKLSKQRQLLAHEPTYVKNKNSSDYELNESEPDYCSISEIQDNINSVKIVTAEVHNDANNRDDDDDDDNEYDEIKEVPTHNNSHNSSQSLSEVAEESFEDVPKLPNVYSIVSLPSTPVRKDATPTKIIGLDNYITKSPMKKKISSPATAYMNDISNVSLSKSKNALKSLPPKVPPPPVPVNVAVKDHQQQSAIKIIDETFQEEFDWYNLDAEYTKSMDVIATQIENIEEMYQFDDENLNDKDSDIKVEYNLEFEFDKLQQDEVEEEMEDQQHENQQTRPIFSTSLSSSDGNEMETNNEGFTTVIKINNGSSGSSSELSSTPPSTPPVTIKTTNLELAVAETPKLDLKKKLNYEKFLSESGMLSKSLLGGRKKFYAGSFV